MASPRGDGGGNPFSDLTNIVNTDPGDETKTNDPKERRRKRDRERYANMPADKKAALLKARREAYHSKKVTAPQVSDQHRGELQSTQPQTPQLSELAMGQGMHDVVVQTCSSHSKKVSAPQGSDQCREELQSTQPQLPQLSGLAMQKGMHEAVVQTCSSAPNKENMPPHMYQENENIMSVAQIKNSMTTSLDKHGSDIQNNDSVTIEPMAPHSTCEAVGLGEKRLLVKRQSDRRRYTNLTPEQRQKRRVAQNARYVNMTPEQKKTKTERESALSVLRRNAPSKDSIAMMNPMYMPSEMDHGSQPTDQAAASSHTCPSLPREADLHQDLPDDEIHVWQ